MKKSMYAKACDYIEYRKGLGYLYRMESYMLRSFGKYADIHAPGKPLRIKTAIEWASLPNGARTYHAKRLSALRPFARHLLISDPRTEVIPVNVFGPSSSRAEAYIYSSDEIRRLMDEKPYCKPRAIENDTFSVVIGLLACTGLRIGEALMLKREDIDWEQKIITVLWSKKLPVRFVPVDETTMIRLREYEKIRDKAFPKSTCSTFFVNFEGKRWNYRTFSEHWGQLVEKTNVGQKHATRPRLHDLRHTFACNFLLHAYKRKMDMDVAIHLLSVYLGHSHIRDTYWYLSGIPDLMRLCCNRFETLVDDSWEGGES